MGNAEPESADDDKKAGDGAKPPRSRRRNGCAAS